MHTNPPPPTAGTPTTDLTNSSRNWPRRSLAAAAVVVGLVGVSAVAASGTDDPGSESNRQHATCDEDRTSDLNHVNVVVFNDKGEVIRTFDGDGCQAESALDDVSVHDYFHSNTVVNFDSDDATCEFRSFFGENGISLKDIDLGDLSFSLNSDDDQFSVGLDTGGDTIGLDCEKTK